MRREVLRCETCGFMAVLWAMMREHFKEEHFNEDEEPIELPEKIPKNLPEGIIYVVLEDDTGTVGRTCAIKDCTEEAHVELPFYKDEDLKERAKRWPICDDHIEELGLHIGSTPLGPLERISKEHNPTNPFALDLEDPDADIYRWSMYGQRDDFHKWNEEHWGELSDGNVWKELLRPRMEPSKRVE